MSKSSEKVAALVAAQQQNLNANSLEYVVGELLKDMAQREPHAADLLAADLENPDMGIAAAGKQLFDYARKHQKSHSYSVTDTEARRLLREFYHIPDAAPAAAAAAEHPTAITPVNILDLL